MESDDETKNGIFYLSSKAETVINGGGINDVFESICSTIISNLQKSFAKCLVCIINSVIDHTINSFKYKPLSGNYIKLLKELDHPKKSLINIANLNGNECFKWCLVRYLHPADHNPKELDF